MGQRKVRTHRSSIQSLLISGSARSGSEGPGLGLILRKLHCSFLRKQDPQGACSWHFTRLCLHRLPPVLDFLDPSYGVLIVNVVKNLCIGTNQYATACLQPPLVLQLLRTRHVLKGNPSYLAVLSTSLDSDTAAFAFAAVAESFARARRTHLNQTDHFMPAFQRGMDQQAAAWQSLMLGPSSRLECWAQTADRQAVPKFSSRRPLHMTLNVPKLKLSQNGTNRAWD